jgi:hypothetical protein
LLVVVVVVAVAIPAEVVAEEQQAQYVKAL